jgi:hypothetical protein
MAISASELDTTVSVRLTPARAKGAPRSRPALVDPLVRRLADPDPDVRQLICLLLAACGQPT